MPHRRFEQAIGELLSDIPEDQRLFAFDQPVLFGGGSFQGLPVPSGERDYHSDPSTGAPIVLVEPRVKKLAGGPHLFLATPFEVDGKPGVEPEARRVLNLAVSLLCLHTGVNLLRHCVFEGRVVAAEEGAVTVPDRWLRAPMGAEGPFLGSQNGVDIAEISERLAQMRQPKRRRVELALDLLGKATRGEETFFDYWLALEVVCDGKKGKIANRLGATYGTNSHKAAYLTGLSTLGRWRDNYVHKGIRPPVTATIERYLQLLFLDLLRHEIDLPPRCHAGAMLNSPGHSLAEIGLAAEDPG